MGEGAWVQETRGATPCTGQLTTCCAEVAKAFCWVHATARVPEAIHRALPHTRAACHTCPTPSRRWSPPGPSCDQLLQVLPAPPTGSRCSYLPQRLPKWRQPRCRAWRPGVAAASGGSCAPTPCGCRCCPVASPGQVGGTWWCMWVCGGLTPYCLQTAVGVWGLVVLGVGGVAWAAGSPPQIQGVAELGVLAATHQSPPRTRTDGRRGVAPGPPPPALPAPDGGKDNDPARWPNQPCLGPCRLAGERTGSPRRVSVRGGLGSAAQPV